MGILNSIFGGGQNTPQERKEPLFFASGNPENPSTPLTDIPDWSEWLGYPGGRSMDWAPRVTERTAMACSAVYRCVTLEAGVIAGLPLKIDLAFGLEKTSRLGCQIVMTDALDGLVVRLPSKA